MHFLQDEIASENGLKVGTLSSLTAIFVLQHAQEKYSWTPEQAGISQGQAAEAAAAFGKVRAGLSCMCLRRGGVWCTSCTLANVQALAALLANACVGLCMCSVPTYIMHAGIGTR